MHRKRRRTLRAIAVLGTTVAGESGFDAEDVFRSLSVSSCGTQKDSELVFDNRRRYNSGKREPANDIAHAG